MKRFLILACAILAAGCTDDAAAPIEERGGTAAGEVLGGSVSDAMIPLEQLESQAPLLPPRGPTAADVDAEQPEIAGDATPPSEGTEAAPAASAPEPAPAE